MTGSMRRSGLALASTAALGIALWAANGKSAS